MLNRLAQQAFVGLSALVVITGLSLPAARRLAATCLAKGEGGILMDGDGPIYRDRDGSATPVSTKAYSDTRPRVAAWLSVVVGGGAAVASRVLETMLGLHREGDVWARAAAWSGLMEWVRFGATRGRGSGLSADSETRQLLVCVQCASLPGRKHYAAKHRLCGYGILSCLVLAVSVATREGLDAPASWPGPGATEKTRGGLLLVQVAASLAAATSLAAVPRRPDVYDGRHGSLVDQQHTASLLQQVTFSWNRVVFEVAKQRQINMDDIPVLGFETRARNLQAAFLARCGEGRLWWQLVRVFSHELVLQWSMTLVLALLQLFPQIVLFNFLGRIERLQDPASTDPALFGWVLGLFVVLLLQVAVGNRLKWITSSRLDIPVGSLLQSLVFAKALRQYETAAPAQQRTAKGPAGKERGTSQSVINHMKLDSNRVCIFCTYNNHLATAVFKLVLAGGFLTQLLGWKATTAGLGAAMLMVPLTSPMSKKYSELQFGLMKYRDAKAHLLTEALQGMRQIKYSALEQHWENKILASRNDEIIQYGKVAVWQSWLILVINMGPLLLASVALSAYAWQNGTRIRASVVFTSLGLFDQLDDAIAMLPLLQSYMLEAWASAGRLERYLSQADKAPIAQPADAIRFNKASVAWPWPSDTDGELSVTRRSTLRNLSLEFPVGKLSVITGKTGAGKSLLLAAILGEVKLLSGEVHVPAPPSPTAERPGYIPPEEWTLPSLMCFVSQTPWIESGTVRGNILFGLPLVEPRYTRVLRACALECDLQKLADGDETEVGPKGVTLSGGQRWRVALARALYSRAGILVLDDILSAVDAHVGRQLVAEALTSGVLSKGRTQILATHHAELVAAGASYLVKLGDDGTLEVAETVEPPAEAAGPASASSDDTAFPGPALVRPGSPAAGNGNGKKAKHDERREKGRVKWSVYGAYCKAGGAPPVWATVVLLLVAGQVLHVLRTWSLKELSQQPPTAAVAAHQPWPIMSLDAMPDQWRRGVVFWMGAYVVVCVVLNMLQMMRVLASFVIGITAAKTLFERMTHTVLRAPLAWLDTVPSGRILNRFTSDTFMVDRRLSSQAMAMLRSVLGILVIVAASMSVSAWVVMLGAVLLVFYAHVAVEYVNTAREIKRINSVSHSPIYDLFGSVLSGLSTIRAFGRSGHYMDRMFGLIDASSKATWALQLSSRWMAFRMGLLGAVFVTAVAAAVALGRVGAALAGFSLTFALRYTGALTSVLQNMTSVELAFNACERVLEYGAIETEPDGGQDIPAAWPTRGLIQVEHLTVAYGDGEETRPVLKNLNFAIAPGERVGIVGRTGAGKSTLASVLFRLLEPRKGRIVIDGLDIAGLKLAQLRSRLAIIPQDPFLFSGTLRSNLDRDGDLDDHEIWTALESLHLVEPNTANIFTNLSYPVSIGGANLSQGQRQLVCLARALLARPKIVVLDEATSAVDRRTDAQIQDSLRREFAAQGCTVLVIAHRLSTVADFDRVLVLEDGEVAEMGTPGDMLDRKNGGDGDGNGFGKRPGAFWELVEKSAERERLVGMILGNTRVGR